MSIRRKRARRELRTEPSSATASSDRARFQTLFWEVTNRCNLRCETCYNKPFLNDKRFSLALDEGLAYCAAIIRSGVRKVVFLGGEPLADRNLLRYIEALRESGVQCSISTNGTLIDVAVAQELTRLGVSLICVSLDSGVRELNDAVRGRGTFDRAVRGLRTLAKCQQDGTPRIAIACTLARENSARYEALFELASEIGIVDIFFNKYLKVNESSLTTSDARSFVQDLLEVCVASSAVGDFYLYLPTMPLVAAYLREVTGVEVIAKEEGCDAVEGSLLLADDHNVYPCSMARVEHPEFGAQFAGDLRPIVRSSGMRRFVAARSAMRSRMPTICEGCVYRANCATRCVLTADQTKYYLACEAIPAPHEVGVSAKKASTIS